MARIRLYVDHPLAPSATVPLTREQAHYLFGVMRLAVGDGLAVFDGQSGEWAADVVEVGKRGGLLSVTGQSAPHLPPADLWLLFAPLKKARTDFVVEKAVEMGAARICPVLTRYTNSDRVRLDKMRAHVIEAAEQCGATALPEVTEPEKLGPLLDGWDPARRIMFCDEAAAGAGAALPAMQEPGPWAVLIGPEGGFSDEERTRLHGLDHAHPVSLGPRILRAETAAVAALTLWQSTLGEW